jgi:hypothetical protein
MHCDVLSGLAIGMTELKERTMDVKQGVSSGRNAMVRRPSKQIECALASKPNSGNFSLKEKQVESIFDLFDEASFRYWEREISKGRFPTSLELADLLDANSDSIIPSWLNPIIIQGLRGNLRGRAGRPPATVWENMILQVAIAQYEDYLSQEQAHEKASNLTGESALHVGSPHERAARRVTAHWLPHMNWRSFLNLVSSRKSRRAFCE